MPLEFHNDAICLSGIFGTELKSKIIGQYYKYWWKITSGGPRRQYKNPTCIVEMNAATGEVYIEEEDKIVLGSAGHALELKFNIHWPETQYLKLIFIEENDDCIKHLKNVIKNRFPMAGIETKKISFSDRNKVSILKLDSTISTSLLSVKENHELGHSLFFFDPLRYVRYEDWVKVYGTHVNTPFKSGTEFLLFLFTSDFISGRNDFSPLPKTTNGNDWTVQEFATVQTVNQMIGTDAWQRHILKELDDVLRIEYLLKYYRIILSRYFRFVIPMPFSPKPDEIYHMIFCTNYRTGANLVTDFYRKYTGNQWSPSNSDTYKKFRILHPNLKIPDGKRKSIEWRVLWVIIKSYVYGMVDELDNKIRNELNISHEQLRKSLLWLEKKKYILHPSSHQEIKRYRPNWNEIVKQLELKKPQNLKPLTEKEFDKGSQNV